MSDEPRQQDPVWFADKEHNKYLYRFIRQHVETKEEAQDLLQEVWLKACQYPKWESIQNIHAWLFKMALNVIKNYYRKNKQLQDQVNGLEKWIDEFTDDPRSALWWKMDLDKALQYLSHEHFEVIFMYYFQGKSIREISPKIGIPEGTVKSRLHAAKTALLVYTRREKNPD